MMFMRFPIDAVFLGRPDPERDGGAARGRPSIAGCGAWTGLVPLVRGAHGVLELPVGTIERDRDRGRRPSIAPGGRAPVSEASSAGVSRRCTAGAVAVIAGAWPTHRAVLDRLASRRLDLAFPATCAGCGREGAPLCAALPCRPSTRASSCPAGRPIGLPADLPAPLLQLEWCAPFAGPVRAALHDLKYAGERRLAEPLGEAVARRWARVGAGARRPRAGPGPRRPRAPARLRPGGPHRRGRRGATLGLPVARRPRAAAARRSRSSSSAATERAANVAGAFRLRVATGRSPGGRRTLGRCSSTTS